MEKILLEPFFRNHPPVEELIQKAVDQFQEAKANGDEPDKAAAAAGLRVIAIAAVDIRGFDDAGQPVQALIGFEKKLSEAFKTPEGESTMFEASADRRWASAQVESVRAPGVRALTEVRAQAIEAFKAQKREAALLALAGSLVDDAAASGDFAAAVRKKGLTLDLDKREFNRESVNQTPFAPLASQMFSIRAGETFQAPIGDGLVVFSIDAITRADPSLQPGIVDQRRQQASNVLQQSLIEASSSLALTEAKVRINQPRLNALVGRVANPQDGAR
jgi:hypothetical protein